MTFPPVDTGVVRKDVRPGLGRKVICMDQRHLEEERWQRRLNRYAGIYTFYGDICMSGMYVQYNSIG